jgi:hypothetical protein
MAFELSFHACLFAGATKDENIGFPLTPTLSRQGRGSQINFLPLDGEE